MRKLFLRPGTNTIDRPLVWLVGGGLAGLLLYGLYGLLFRVDRQSLVQVSCTLAEQPAVLKTKGRNPTKYLWLPIREWRGLNFSLGKPAFKATRTSEFVQTASAGDSVQLWVNRQDYDSKMTRGTKAAFWEDLLNSASQVQVFQLSLKGRNYLTVDDYERQHRLEFWVDWLILSLLWVFLVVCRVNGWLPRESRPRT